MSSPPPTLPSHLALLARLELLHQSGILSSSGGSYDAHSYLNEHDAEPLEGVNGGWGGKGAGDEAWREVKEMLRLLGDGLRDERLRIPLGQTSLPLALSDILRLAIEKPPFTLSRASTATSIQTVTYDNPGLPDSSASLCPTGETAEAIVEICRVAGNMCFDCDANRTILLSHQLPQSLLGLVSMLHESPRPVQQHYPLVKSALGALLNISLEHEGVQTLIAWSDNSVEAVLSLANQLYTPLEYTRGETSTGPGAEERVTVALWAWKTIHEVSQLDPAPSFDPQSVLPSFLRPIKAFLSGPSPLPSSPLLAQDLHLLSLCTSTLASQTIASEPFQLALFNTPFFLSSLLGFIELVSVPPQPAPAPPPQRNEGSLSSDDETDDEEEEEDHGKTLGMVKGTLVSVVVAVFGEDEVGELVLGPNGDGEGRELREVLERWVGLAVAKKGDEGREDLGICAVLSLGNLARNESHCIALLAPPSPLLERVLPLLSPRTDLKLQHGLVGLLKNLSIPDANKALLGSAGVAELVVGMGCLASERDNVGSVQGGAVGILKFLAKGSVSNALRIVLSSPTSSSPVPLEALLTFQARSADPALKMESGRTLVNLARTLFSTTAEADPRLEEGRTALSGNPAVIDGLVALVRNGSAGGYMGLVGEGVMGLAVVASSGVEAASKVAASLLRPLPTPASSNPAAAAATSSDSPPPSEIPTLQTLTSLLSLATTAIALKINLLALLGAAGRGAGSSAEASEFEAAVGAGAGEEGEDEGLKQAREVARGMLRAGGQGVREE